MYKDDFGLDTSYGLDENGKADMKYQAGAQNKYAVKQLVIALDVNELGTTSSLVKSAMIPEGSAILGVDLVITKSAATPATTITVGTCKKDGVAIDDDGLVTASQLTAGASVAQGALISTVVGEHSYICAKVSNVANAAGAEGCVIIDYV